MMAAAAPARRNLLARIHIARKEMGLDEETYRDLLEQLAGARSAAQLDDAGLRAVLEGMKARGWKPRRPARRRWRKAARMGHQRKVWAMWGELKRQGVWRDADPASLRAFVRRMTGVDDPDWLDAANANTVIEALKSMGERAGVDWEAVS